MVHGPKCQLYPEGTPALDNLTLDDSTTVAALKLKIMDKLQQSPEIQAGLATLFTQSFCKSKHIQLMTSRMLRETKPDTPRE
jgi:hypothetical protein